MRYDDASQTGSTGHSEPVARPDEDRLPAGSFGPATGNAITGAGTTSGASGADHVGAGPATITAVQGAGGQTVSANGAYQAAGQFGLLSMDMQGNFSYVRNPGTPDGVKDVFNYTLADASGANSSTTLTIDIGQVAAAAAGQGIVNLPQGVELSDIHVNGRDLIVNMPDGTQMVIPGGAVFVPQLVIGDVQVPPTNLAALLIDNEPQPAAGQPLSSGGNFADPVPPLDPGVPLGDLIPPTELHYTPPEFRDIGQFADTQPSVVIEPHDLAPGVVNAVDQVDEAGLPAPRDGDSETETPGTGEIADGIGNNDSDSSESTFGSIVFTAGDGVGSITVDGVTISGASVGTQIQGQFGVMTITSVNLAGGTIGYTYTLTDNTSGDNTADHFTVVVTDSDGDTATATLTVDIIDDTPIARNDTDAIGKGADAAEGNVLTGAGTTSGAAGADTPGADNLVNNGNGVTGIHAGSAAATFTNVTNGGTLVHGTFGDLVIHSDGSYTYTLTATNGTAGGNDVFTYQITDGDGDTSTATLTIGVPSDTVPVADNANALVDDDNLPIIGNNDHAPGDDDPTPNPDAQGTTVSGTLTANFGSDSAGSFNFTADMDGKVVQIGQEQVTYHVVGDVLTAEVSDGARTGTDLFTVTLNADGTYAVHLINNVLQVDDGTNTENNASASIGFTATDSDGDTSAPATLTISLDDDIPVAIVPPPPGEGDGPPPPLVTGLVDEDDLPTGNHDSAPGDDNPGNADGDNDGTTTGGGAGSLDALFNAGADSPLSFSLGTNTSGLPVLHSDGALVTYSVSGDVLTASANGHTVFTLTVNANGSWTFDLQGQLDHPAGGNENNLLLDLSSIVVGTDSDGDSAVAAPGGFVVNVDDDMPAQIEGSVQANVDEDELPGGITDHDNETTQATGSLATQAHIGADQPGSFSFDTNALGNLPALTSHGVAVDYTVSNGMLIAYLDGGNPANAADQVFTVNLTQGGDYTVNLLAQIDHPADQVSGQPANDDQNVTIDLSGAIQVSDADGDTIHLDARSFLINIEDDVPDAQTNGNGVGSVTLDESAQGTDTPGASPPAGDSSETINLAAGFVSGANVQFGADGAASSGSVSYGLHLSGSNVGSGLFAVDAAQADGKGDEIVLNQAGNVITGSANGTNYFTITIDPATGVATFHQLTNIWHPDAGSTGAAFDDTATLTTANPSDISVVQTVTDFDGDQDSASINLGAGVFNIQDDGPTARNDVDEIVNGGSTATGNVISGADTTSLGAGADSSGADAPIKVVAINSASHGTDTSFSGGFLSIQGDHGTIQIDANGNYTYTRSDGEGGVQDEFTYTIQDADGDTTTATLTIHIEDNVPSLAAPDVAHLDDDAVSGANGNLGGTGDDLPNPPSPDVASGTLHGTGGDGTLTYHFSANADQTGLPSGFSIDASSTATNMVIDQLQNGVEVHVLTIALNTGTGAYSVTQTAPIIHPSQAGTADANTENNISDINVSFFVQDADGDHSNVVNLNINVDDDTPTLSVTKGADGGVNVTTDDADTIGASTDHSTATSANFGGVFGLTFSAGADGTSTTPTLGYTLGVQSQGALSGLTSHGSAIHLYLLANGEVVGSTAASAPASDSDASVVFSVTVNGTGQVTLNQMQQIDHPTEGTTGAPFNDQSVSMADNLITLTASASITDKDGDTASGTQTVDIGANLHFTDDGPDISAVLTGTQIRIDETDGVVAAGGEVDPVGGNLGTVTMTAAQLYTVTTNHTSADAPQTLGYALTLSAQGVDSGLDVSSNNANILLYNIGGVIYGSTATTAAGVDTAGDSNVAFTVSIDSTTGDVTLTQFHAIEHGNPLTADEDSPAFASNVLGVTITATDFDHDTDTATVDLGSKIVFEDDAPTAALALTGSGAVSVDETPGVQGDANDTTSASVIALFGGVTNTGTDPDMPAQYAANAAAVVTTAGSAIGSDTPGTTLLSLNVSTAGVDSGLNTTDGHDILLFKEGNLIVGRVSGGADNGKAAFAVAIDQSGHLNMVEYLSIQHPNTGSADESVSINNSAIVAVVTVTDADSDSATQSVAIGSQISFQDDGPTLGAFTEANIENAVGHVDGTYAFDWGADGFGGLTVTGPPIPGITYTTTTAADGSVTLHGNSGATEVFNLDVHPDGTYTFNLVTPDAGSTTTQSLLGLKSGNSEFIQTDDGLVEMTPNDHNGADTGTVNSSTVGFGNGNQFTGNGEAISFEFHSTNQAGDQTPDTNPKFVDSVTLTAPSNGFNGSTETITWFATNTQTHETATGTIQVDTNTSALVITPGFSFNELTIEGSDADGNGIRLTQISETTTVLPQSEDLSFTINATDGDGDPTSTSTLTVHVNADAQSQAAVHTQSLMMSELDTSSLASSNDNEHQQQRTFAAGTNAALIGAVAAAGLESLQVTHGGHLVGEGFDHASITQPMHDMVVSTTALDTPHLDTAHVQLSIGAADTGHAAQHGNGGVAHDMVESARPLTTATQSNAAPTELLHGSEAPAHAQGAVASPVAAMAVTMPSAAQLAAAGSHGVSQPQNSVGGATSQHDQVVSKVLVDALHGGGSGPNIEAALNGLSSHGGGQDALQALASHGAGAVSFGHTAFADAFGGAHGMQVMQLHPDVAPVHG